MMAVYVRFIVEWWSENIVRQVAGLLLLAPLVIGAIWLYGHLLYWFSMLIGIPSDGALMTAIVATILTIGGVGGLVANSLTR